jgi:hypothetical protein
MFCSSCGSKLPNEAAFCPSCGNAMNVAIGSESSTTASFQKYVENVAEAPSDKWAWTLACVPILGMILVSIIDTGSELGEIVIFVILNIIFCTLDIKELEKKGYSPEGWVWLGLLLVPVYLFVRASRTGKKYGYAITWCVLFVLSCMI